MSLNKLLLLQTCVTDEIERFGLEHCLKLPETEFYIIALVSKINGAQLNSPLLITIFDVDQDILVHGLGCDNSQRCREEQCIKDVMSKNAKRVPKIPYYHRLF